MKRKEKKNLHVPGNWWGYDWPRASRGSLPLIGAHFDDAHSMVLQEEVNTLYRVNYAMDLLTKH
jgi:hypothetical protein